jgi:hypothetical protein
LGGRIYINEKGRGRKGRKTGGRERGVCKQEV